MSQSRLTGVRRLATRYLPYALLLTAIAGAADAQSSRQVRVAALKQRFHLLSSPSGNLVVYVDDTVSLVAGYHSPALVRAARALLDSLHAPRVGWALVLESDSARAFGDGGWGRLGAVVIADENLRPLMHRYADSVSRLGKPAISVGFPLVGFSDALQVILPHEEVHFVHRPRGLTIRDVVIHFEVGNIVMLGNLLSAYEYPDITRTRRQGIQSLIDTMDWFTDSLPRRKVEPIVPGRGPTLKVEDLREYRRMLATTVWRVDALKRAGKSEDQVVAARPTREFDARWGRGRVSPEQFVRMVYRALASS